MNRKHSNKVNVVGCVRIEGEHTEQNMEKATINVEETQEKMGNVDVVLLVDLVRHGKKGERGFGPERHDKVIRTMEGDNTVNGR